MTDGMNGMDRESEGADYDAQFCPDECRGELRDSCGGCTHYDEDGEAIC